MRRTWILSALALTAGCGAGAPVVVGPGDAPGSTATAGADRLPAASTNGLVAAWDMCGWAGPMQIIDPDGGEQVATVALAGRPAWSPDGGFVATLDTMGGIRVIDLARGTVQVVVELGLEGATVDRCGTVGDVAWSPDGTALLARHRETGADGPTTVVRALRVDGSADRVLYEAPAGASSVVATWLPDGSVLVASLAEASGRGIVLQPGDPWGAWPPTAIVPPQPSAAGNRVQAVSADGTHLALAAPDGAGGIVVMDTADGSSRRVTVQRPAGEVAFSPDGTQLGLVAQRRGLEEAGAFVAVAIDGSSERVVEGAHGNVVAWSPDSQSVVVGGTALHRVDLASGTVVELVPPGRGAFAPGWGSGRPW